MKRFIMPLTAQGLINLIDMEKQLFAPSNRPILINADKYEVCRTLDDYRRQSFGHTSALVLPEQLLNEAEERTGYHYTPVLYLVDKRVLVSVTFSYRYTHSTKVHHDILGLSFNEYMSIDPNYDLRV